MRAHLVDAHRFMKSSSPPTVKAIKNDAFALCSELTSVKLGERLEEIGDGAFRLADLASLQLFILVRDWKRSEMRHFGNCSSLQRIVIPRAVIKINDEAFF